MKKKSTSPSGFLSLRAITILFCATAACSILNVPLLAFLRPQGQATGSQRTLSFEERVSHQKAIEDVYWRHRIWPKGRPDPKPSLDAVMSQAQLEKKVTDYLRNSQALEDYWQRPITAEQLQAEMERMAKHTRQPEVLRELFEALGNDPFVIAECLARSALAERLVTNWYAYDQRIHGELKQRAETELQAHPTADQMKQLSGKYNEIEFFKSDGSPEETHCRPEHGGKLTSPEWDQTVQRLATTFAKPDARKDSAFGVQRPQLVGTFQSADTSVRPKGRATKTYESIPIGKLSQLQEDEDRFYATVVMEKTKDRLKLAIVAWSKEPSESWLTRSENQVPAAMAAPGDTYTLPEISGGGCIDDTWADIVGPPDGRSGHTAVWTGTEMIVWGGFSVEAFNTGGRYTPATDAWASTSVTNAPDVRYGHTAVWTGSEMIVWGGYIWDDIFGRIDLNTGGKYDPGTNNWTPTSPVNAPAARSGHRAVWTGSEMIVWGGFYGLNTGGRYNPGTDNWVPTSTSNAPSGRSGHTAVWTGNEMVVWGGCDDTGYGCNLNTGGKYNPDTNSWTATSINDAPSARSGHTAVWTGTEMIVWGGGDDNQSFDAGARYNPVSDTWSPTSTTNAPTARSNHTAVWTGSEMLIWGGNDNVVGYTNTGSRYNPSTDSWTPISTTNAPDSRTGHTAVWSGTNMIVWGGDLSDGIDHYLNTGGRYDPTTDSWTPTGTNNTPMGRYRHTAIWTGAEMVIWGGRTRNFPFLNTGGKYNPSTENWTATTINDAPTARVYHTAVWTGSDMIVWGGLDESFTYSNTGARYNPGTDGWIATSTANAPAGRWFHTAVWTGNRMVVWGGSYDDGSNTLYLNSGGMYNPITDSWSPTSTTNAPIGRDEHVAVWTANEMIVWGGYSYDGNDHYFNTGGRFDPDTNTWATTSTTNAPSARSVAKAVWTGNEMITWGGYGNAGYVNTGGKYNPSTNTWMATGTTNAPSARAGHSVLWTDSEMIVWGGYFFDGNDHVFNTGGRYDPNTNSWTATSTVDVPVGRTVHTAAWTGNEMLIWGGVLFANVGTSTGGRYCVQSGPTPTPSPTPTPTPCMGRCSPTPRPRPTPPVRPTPPR